MSQEEQSLNCETCDQRRVLNSKKYDRDERLAVMMLYRDLKDDLIKLQRYISDGRHAIPGISFNIRRDNRIIVDFYYIPESATVQRDIDWQKRQIMHISLFPDEGGGIHTTIPGKPEKDSPDFPRRLYLTNEHILNCLGNGSKYYTLLNFLKTWAHYFKTEQPITSTKRGLTHDIRNFIDNCLDRRLYPTGDEPTREEKKIQLVDLLEALYKSVLELCEQEREREREVGMGEGVGSIREGAAEMDVGEDGWVGEGEGGVGRTKRGKVRTAVRYHPHSRPTVGGAAGTKRGRGGGSTKSVLYLVKIEKLRELNKKLRKNKTKNKNKIEKNNKQIDELKIKIKKEKAMAKEKLKKEKAMAKEKLKKEKAKAKEKLKKQKAKKVHITKKIKK